jgi:hypothetical protein
MKDFSEIPQPIIPDICASRDHYFNMIVDGKCFSCGAVWGLGELRKQGLVLEAGRRTCKVTGGTAWAWKAKHPVLPPAFAEVEKPKVENPNSLFA